MQNALRNPRAWLKVTPKCSRRHKVGRVRLVMISAYPHTSSRKSSSKLLKEKQEADALKEKSVPLTEGASPNEASETTRRRKRAATKSSGKSLDSVPDRTEAEAVVNLIQGHLVEWPYDW